MSTALSSVIVPAVTKHSATVIFVHGLGDSGYGWKPVADFFKTDPALQHIKWVLPNAPMSPVTANMGMEMPSWFDILAFGGKAEEDKAGMLKTSKSLMQLVDKEIESGVPPERVVLGGFSQGAAMALLTGLTIKEKLAGLVVLSGWVPIPSTIKETISPHSTTLPIFVGHGTADPMVKLDRSQASMDYLKELGFPFIAKSTLYSGIVYNTYRGMAHSTNPQELDDLKAWLKQALP